MTYSYSYFVLAKCQQLYHISDFLKIKIKFLTRKELELKFVVTAISECARVATFPRLQQPDAEQWGPDLIPTATAAAAAVLPPLPAGMGPA